MRWETLLPSQWRVGALRVASDLRLARQSLRAKPRPVFSARQAPPQKPPPHTTDTATPSPQHTPSPAPDRGTIPVRFEASGQTLAIDPDDTLLEAGLDAGLDLDFSCQVGGCGSCIVKVLSGQFEMEEPNCLTDDERDTGHCLACITRALGPMSIDA